MATPTSTPSEHPVLRVSELGFPWATADPFLACMHHDDRYPAGAEDFGPAVPLAGRDIGQDFSRRDGWSMYHGRRVPGFPRHPHRGFETVTVVRSGRLDHADSSGARARYGDGDVQWLTTGAGIQHSEMFPLLRQDGPNRVELFQIWLNLPAASKMVTPYFSMAWAEDIPHLGDAGVDVAVLAGRIDGAAAPPPPPDSWAAREESHLLILAIRLQPGAAWTLPAAHPSAARSLYLFEADALEVAGRTIPGRTRVELRADAPVELRASAGAVEILLLQGAPIGEPVAHYGPFVMNTRAELARAFEDYQRTGFGVWPFDRDDPVHGRDERFAHHADGRFERPPG